jgi:hypothetical protein
MEVLLIDGKPETVGQFPERAVAVDYVVGYGNDIKAGLAEEINGFL